MLQRQLAAVLVLSLTGTTPLSAHEPKSWVPQQLAQPHGVSDEPLTLCREAPIRVELPANESRRDPWAVLSRYPELDDGIELRLVRSRDCNAPDDFVLWLG